MLARKMVIAALLAGCSAVGIEGEATQEESQALQTAAYNDDGDFENVGSTFWYFGSARTERIGDPYTPGEHVAELTSVTAPTAKIHSKSVVAPLTVTLRGVVQATSQAYASIEWYTTGSSLVRRDRIALPASSWWTPFELTAIRPSPATYVRMRLESPEKGEALFDNVFMDAAEPGIFANGSFSGPLRDWYQYGSRNYRWSEETGAFQMHQGRAVPSGAILGIELRGQQRIAVPVSATPIDAQITLAYGLRGQGTIGLAFFDSAKRRIGNGSAIVLPAQAGAYTNFSYVIPPGTASLTYTITMGGQGTLDLYSAAIYNGTTWTYHAFDLDSHLYESMFNTFKTLGVPFDGTSANYRQFDDSAAGISLQNEDATLPSLEWESLAYTTGAIFTRHLKMSFSIWSHQAREVSVTLICYTVNGDPLEGEAIFGGEEISGNQEVYFLTPPGGCYQPDVRLRLEGTGRATLDEIVIEKTL